MGAGPGRGRAGGARAPATQHGGPRAFTYSILT